jgi:hypothetical protein
MDGHACGTATGRPQSDMQNASYWEHLLSWWAHRDDPNVLLVFFEDLKADLRGSVRRIAAFMDQAPRVEERAAEGASSSSYSLATDEAAIDDVVRLASFQYMSEHAHQFDEHVLKRVRNPHMGLPPVRRTPPSSPSQLQPPVDEGGGSLICRLTYDVARRKRVWHSPR